MVHVHVEGLEHRKPSVAVAVDVIPRDDGMVRATVQEQPRFMAVAHVVVRDGHVVAPFGGNNTVVA